MTTGKTIALTRWTFVGKVIFLLFNMLSSLVITCLPMSKHFFISWLQSPSAVILEPKKIKSATVSTVSPSICHPWKKWKPQSFALLTLCCCSVSKSHLTLCDPMNCSMPGFSLLHYLPEYAQTHVHWVVMPSNHLITLWGCLLMMCEFLKNVFIYLAAPNLPCSMWDL